MTICTDLDRRNFARFGFSINDIDTEADVEVQANEAVSAVLKVFSVGNDGMEIAVKEALTDISSTDAKGLRAELDQLAAHVENVRTNLIPNIVSKVREVEARLPGEEGESGEEGTT